MWQQSYDVDSLLHRTQAVRQVVMSVVFDVDSLEMLQESYDVGSLLHCAKVAAQVNKIRQRLLLQNVFVIVYTCIYLFLHLLCNCIVCELHVF